MEEKKYIFCVFYRQYRRFVVPFNADIRPLAVEPDGGGTES